MNHCVMVIKSDSIETTKIATGSGISQKSCYPKTEQDDGAYKWMLSDWIWLSIASTGCGSTETFFSAFLKYKVGSALNGSYGRFQLLQMTSNFFRFVGTSFFSTTYEQKKLKRPNIPQFHFKASLDLFYISRESK